MPGMPDIVAKTSWNPDVKHPSFFFLVACKIKQRSSAKRTLEKRQLRLFQLTILGIS